MFVKLDNVALKFQEWTNMLWLMSFTFSKQCHEKYRFYISIIIILKFVFVYPYNKHEELFCSVNYHKVNDFNFL